MNDYSNFDSDELLAFAKRDMSESNYEAALTKAKVIISRGPFPIDVFALLGKIYASVGLYERARLAFTRFVDEVPEAVVETFQLGMVEYDLGNTKEAEQIWLGVLERSPNYPPALYHLAIINMDSGAIDTAKDYFNAILESAPDDSEYIALADQALTRLSLQ